MMKYAINQADLGEYVGKSGNQVGWIFSLLGGSEWYPDMPLRLFRDERASKAARCILGLLAPWVRFYVSDGEGWRQV
jgi:hypothetical protein